MPRTIAPRHGSDAQASLDHNIFPTLAGSLLAAVRQHQKVQHGGVSIGRCALDILLDEKLAVVRHGLGDNPQNVDSNRVAIVVKASPDKVHHSTWFDMNMSHRVIEEKKGGDKFKVK